VNYVLVAIASSLLLSESISPRRGEGIVLIVVGMFLLNRRPRAVRA
jgi:drug/metabolite transporter (DMT)-like permease